MKTKNILLMALACILWLFLGLSSANAQDTAAAGDPAGTRMQLAYMCGPGDSVTLSATLSVMRNDLTLALENAVIIFLAAVDAEPAPIGTARTNQEGIAVLRVSLEGLRQSKEGVINYTARFEGNGKYLPSEAAFTAKPAYVVLSFSVDDTIKTIKVTAYTLNPDKSQVPLSNETVGIYVPRLFSLFKIGEITLDETGTGTMEFSGKVVGDTLGNLEIIAGIEEHDIYGFVNGKNNINWGIHKQYFKPESFSRELWTPIAPLWMIITLIVMLVGVWAHYIYAVYELIMIRKLGKRNSTQT